jgi:hypothetical protein|tara:strand:- start:6636 stop:6869 length:234 start_codon:yes stop_codon:yes gene_type:complete
VDRLLLRTTTAGQAGTGSPADSGSNALIDGEAAAIVGSFGNAPADSCVATEQNALMKFRAARAVRRDAESRIESAAP